MTPIEELIEELKANDVAHGMYWIKQPTEFFEKYLAKEKKHIIKAVDKNEANCVKYCNRIHNLVADPSTKQQNFYKVDKDAGINYYNETYNK